VVAEMQTGTPEIHSVSTLAFHPDGILFIGDSKGGQIVAIEMPEPAPAEVPEQLELNDVETKFAALLGTTADEIVIHDLAVHPISLNTYVAVSRNRGKWDSRWKIPNDLGDAKLLLRVKPDASIEEVSLEGVRFDIAALPNPVATDKDHMWKTGAKLRIDTITDFAFKDGIVYASGLSNEEFSSAMWRVPYPFGAEIEFSTLEVFHGAHGEYETHAPVRTFLPYQSETGLHILASYLCTPLVTFAIESLESGAHVRGKTVAEFGSGNYPLDMLLCEFKGREFIVVSNSMLPLLTFDPAAATAHEAITEKVESYQGGLSYSPRAGNGVSQLDHFGEDTLLALQRMPNGKLDMLLLHEEWLAD
jgi:hypothetical protein